MSEPDPRVTERPDPGHGIDRTRAWLTGIGLGALVLAALVVAFVIGTHYSDDGPPAAVTQDEAPAPPPAAAGPGKELFVTSCGSCHKLSDAGTSGTAGPDLDALAPDQAAVLQAIEAGGTGSGMMPPGLLSGAEAEQVAEYVAAITGGSSSTP
ncbi:MAG: cytochrome c [Gaiellales bacterium]